MTEYELVDALNSSMEATIAASMAFVTISSAYAIAIHLVGKKLPVFFIYGIAIGYSMWAMLPIRGVFRTVNEMALLAAKLEALRSDSVVSESLTVVYFNSAILGFFWLLCILYTVYVRRSV